MASYYWLKYCKLLRTRERGILNPNPLRPHEGRKNGRLKHYGSLKEQAHYRFGMGNSLQTLSILMILVEGCLRAPRDSAIGQVCDLGQG